jgi:general stress protein 26
MKILWLPISLVTIAACSGSARVNSGPARIAVSPTPVSEFYKVAPDSAILSRARKLMLADSNVALVTVDATGQPRVRTVKAFVEPFESGRPEKGVTVWIMTRFTTRKVDQIRGNSNVTLYFNDDARIEYATIMGTAIVHTDPEHPVAKKFYQDGYAEFFWPEFPEGFVMIEVKPRWLEYLGPGMAGHKDTWRPQAVVFPAGEPASQGATSSIVGTWKLTSFESRLSNGEIRYPMGRQVSGSLMYDSGGRMSAHIMDGSRPKFASGDRGAGTDSEVRQAFVGYLAYWGTYDVDHRRQVVTHHVAGSSYPNWLGNDQLRPFKLEGNKLTITTPPIRGGGEDLITVLVWERVQ